MKKTIRIIASLLLAVMAFTLIAGCADSSDNGTETTDTSEGGDTSAADTTDTDSTATALNIPAGTNYDGQEFRVLTKGTSQTQWQSVDISSESASDDAISNAVYYRNLAVEDTYGIVVVETSVADYFNQTSEALTYGAAGIGDFEMYCLSPETAVSVLINQGYLYDLNEMPYMNLEAEWYDQNSIEQLSLDGHVYMVTGSMLTMDDDATGAILFNKALVEQNNFPDFYEMVREGTWTIDVLTEYAEKCTNDVNGNGELDAATDVFGLLTEYDETNALVAGGGLLMISKNSDDYPELAADSEAYYNMLEKVLNIVNNFDVTLFAEKVSGYSDVWTDCMDVAFKESRALFYACWLNRATLLRDMEDDFGILPYPKYDEEQEDYYSFVSTYCSNSISIPTYVSDIDFVSTAIEVLSYESLYGSNSLTEAYYTQTLEYRNARDEESSEMLDIIFSNTVFDLGMMFDWGSISSLVQQTSGIDGGTASGFATTIASNSKAIEKALEKTMNTVMSQ
ncbi:MAG: hypothetical protein LUG88_00815 [Clostridia bacterium]|nr:hypothetical protein [Clostridia bacterium]